MEGYIPLRSRLLVAAKCCRRGNGARRQGLLVRRVILGITRVDNVKFRFPGRSRRVSLSGSRRGALPFLLLAEGFVVELANHARNVLHWRRLLYLRCRSGRDVVLLLVWVALDRRH